jgi:hypothetical protein
MVPLFAAFLIGLLCPHAPLQRGLAPQYRLLCRFCLSCSRSPITLGPCELPRVTSNPCPSCPARLRTVGRGAAPPLWPSHGGLTAGAVAGAVMAINRCAECLKKPREIDRLTEELQRLKQKLRYQERQVTAGFFGSSTLSAKLSVKATTPPAKEPKRKGTRPGHPGGGRQTFDAS